jgi:hypothetical protein
MQHHGPGFKGFKGFKGFNKSTRFRRIQPATMCMDINFHFAHLSREKDLK